MICGECLNDLFRTDWKPGQGIDPKMRCYHCYTCDLAYYIIVPVITLRHEPGQDIHSKFQATLAGLGLPIKAK